MRLAVITNQFPSRISTFLARDIRSWIESGIEVDVFPIYPLESDLWRFVPEILNDESFSRDRVHHPKLLEALATFYPWPLSKFLLFHKETALISIASLRHGLYPLFKSVYSILLAWVWAKQFPDNFDHILAYWGNYPGSCAYVFHRLNGRKIPFSIFFHAGIDLYHNQIYLREKLLYADNIFVVCEFNRQYLRALFPEIYPKISEKIHLHHLALNLDEFPFHPGNRPLGKVLAVGRLDVKKGFDVLIEAAHILSLRGIDLEIEIIGDGQEHDALRAQAEHLQICEKIKFRGWLPFCEVQKAMTNSTILVHPSIGLGDAVPTVIKEAMALGTPVVGTSVAGIPELLDQGRCGVLVEPQDGIALADAIETLLADESLQITYAYAARKFAEEKFDLWKNGNRFVEILSSTVRTD